MPGGSVFISHTTDMSAFPPGRSFVQAAAEAVSKAGWRPVEMAQFAAREGAPAEYCRRRVRECDVYLAVVGFRYGSPVPGRTDGVSHTELEFLAATEAGMPRLVFVLGEDVPLPRSLIDGLGGAVDGFRERLRRANVIVKTVATPADLGEAVLHALYEQRLHGPGTPGGAQAATIADEPSRAGAADVDEAAAVRRLLDAVRGPRRLDGAPVFPGIGRAGALSSRGDAGPRPPGVLPPVWNLGPRNSGFVGREATLAAVHERLRSGVAAVVQALHGLGGVGKTQLALEYAYRHADAYDLVWWINAEEAGLVGEQYAALAAELGLVAPRADTASAFVALRAHLRGRDRWLLVFDNAESPADLRDWLPAGPGHVMITSRNPGWGELAARVEVDVLTRRESTTLIQARLPTVDVATANRLAGALGDLPLALAQAAGFLAETGMPVDRYLDLLDTHAGELLAEHPPQAHPHSLAAAVNMSTDRLAHVDPAALGFLRIGAFLAPEPIPVDLLTRYVPPTDPGWPAELAAVAAAGSAPVAAHRSLGRIGRFGLARIDDRGMQLHRLTQAILRQTLPAGQAAVHRDYVQALLVAADPGDYRDLATWLGWAQVLPHLLAADPAASPSSGFRDLACRAAWYLWYRGESWLAWELVFHLHERWGDSLGPDDRHTLQISSLFVRILTNGGSGSRARELGEDAVARARRALGDDHPETLCAAHHLAVCLHALGAFEQARRLNADTLARRRRVLGDGHADTQRSAYRLGRDLRALGDAEAALSLLKEIFAHSRRVFGDEHPHTFNAANELGACLREAGDPEAARGMHEATLAGARRVYGDDHLWILICATELARDLHALGDLDAARRLGQETFDRALLVLGDCRLTVDAANVLAACLYALGEYENARRLSEQTLARARRVSGHAHPRTRRAAENLAASTRASADGRTGRP